MPHLSANGSDLDGGGRTTRKSPSVIKLRSSGVRAGYGLPPTTHLMLSHEMENLPKRPPSSIETSALRMPVCARSCHMAAHVVPSPSGSVGSVAVTLISSMMSWAVSAALRLGWSASM